MEPTRLLSAAFWKMLLGRLGAGRSSRNRPVADPRGLTDFLRTRAAHVAQTSLYGYLRTRAGTRFPELFSDDAFVASINIAKWHVWLACVSDLAVYAGALVHVRTHASPVAVGELMQRVVCALLSDTGVPAEAGGEFSAHADRVRARIALRDWAVSSEGEAAFSQSPAALVHWAPVVDELKALDEEVVHNSVRFRWREVRQDLQRVLDAHALMRTGPEAESARQSADTNEA
jgi:hypothetical protein